MVGMVRRSVLFSPGDEPDLLRKAAGTDADCLVLDLEDAVAPRAKDAARETVQTLLEDPDYDPDAEVCVRVNAAPNEMVADIEALAAADDSTLDSVMLPKTGGADDIETLDRRLAEHDLKVPILSLLETAEGILQAAVIAASAPVDGVIFGAEDLAADIGATRTEEGMEVLHAREHLVLAASAAGVDAIDTVYTDFGDETGLREETRFARQLGFDGKLAIHPAQVDPINEAFTPDETDIAWASRVMEVDEATDAAVFEVDGEMIDAPLIAQAERILEAARAAGRYNRP